MIRQMRMQFIGIAMSAVVLMLVVILGTINLFMASHVNTQIESYLDFAISNDGHIDGPGKRPEKEGQDRQLNPAHPEEQIPSPAVDSVSFLMSADKEILQINHNSDEMAEDLMLQYGRQAIDSGEDKGTMNGYKYRLKSADDKWIVVFANITVQDKLLESLLRISYIISGICVVFLFGLVTFLSRFITRPVEMAFDKQKRFIADSSHELKTPLSIMSANLDMLQMEIGDNRRIQAMDLGIKRMNGLIHELLSLARAEQNTQSFREVNLSEVMEGVILPMEVLAFENGTKIEYKIDEDVMIKGDEESLRKMIGALMENALKYGRAKTKIQVALYRKGLHNIIEVFNEGEGVTKEEQKRLFDKFYRVDDSRQRSTGGYGIGLSIVKSVVDLHKGRIVIDSEPGAYVVFRIELPRK